jgi:transposase
MNLSISLPLDIPDVDVLQTRINHAGDVVITVESTLKGTICRQCGRKINKSHGHDDWIELQHLPILGRRSYIRLRPKRYRCLSCDNKPTTTQQLDWYQSRCSTTKAYEEHILLQLVNSTIEDVSHKGAVGYDAIVGIIERCIQKKVTWDEIEQLEILGIDEIALRKGRKDFVAVITARSADGRVTLLTVLPDRKKATVKRFLRSIPHRLRATIDTVCTDMWIGYVNAAKEVLGSKVTIVVDRYHVAQSYREGVDKFRQRERKRLEKELPEEEYKQLKGVMWPFRKNRRDLEQEEKELLERLFSHAPLLGRAYELREELTDIFESLLSRGEAKLKINDWKQKVDNSGLTCFNKFLTTLDNWFSEIINYFERRLNSGFVEGFNNKIKVLKRRCYGIFDVSRIFQRLYLDLEGYRLYAHPYF